MPRVLIAGCGYVGSALGRALASESHEVWGLSRNPGSLPEGIDRITADLAVAESLEGLPAALDAVVYMAAPGGGGDASYRTVYVDGLANLMAALARQGQSPSRVFLVSSTAVYAQHEGEWVDESSPTNPTHFSGRRLLEAEAVLRSAAFPGTVIRFGGIYGPGRTRLLENVRAGRAVYRESPPQWTNRIHRDDCAGVVKHLLGLEDPADVYIGVDCEPARERDVQCWLADALAAPPPRAAPAGDPAIRAARGNKRCRNDRLLASGYTFRHPTYREGYRAVIEGMD
jgi:nucleoside-diphosphate-sugar epimerase